jgi:hypothetical protein
MNPARHRRNDVRHPRDAKTHPPSFVSLPVNPSVHPLDAVSDIVAKRREIQFAADAEWPHTDPANAGIRGEFQLPPDRVVK